MHTLFCGFGILIFLSILFGERNFYEIIVRWNCLPDLIAVCGAISKSGKL